MWWRGGPSLYTKNEYTKHHRSIMDSIVTVEAFLLMSTFMGILFGITSGMEERELAGMTVYKYVITGKIQEDKMIYTSYVWLKYNTSKEHMCHVALTKFTSAIDETERDKYPPGRVLDIYHVRGECYRDPSQESVHLKYISRVFMLIDLILLCGWYIPGYIKARAVQKKLDILTKITVQ